MIKDVICKFNSGFKHKGFCGLKTNVGITLYVYKLWDCWLCADSALIELKLFNSLLAHNQQSNNLYTYSVIPTLVFKPQNPLCLNPELNLHMTSFIINKF
jgi:hypothetical protein